MRPSRVLGLLVICVLLAGCNGLVGGDAETPTVTPAEVPTPEPTPTDPRVGVAPGVSASDVTHPSFLAESHADATRRTSYVLLERYHEDRAFGTVTSELDRTQQVVVENDTVYRRNVSNRVEEMVGGELRSLHGYAEFADGQYLYQSWLSSNDDERAFRRNANPTQLRTDYETLTQGELRQYLTLESATVSQYSVSTSDARHYRVTGTRSSLPAIASVENYTARAVIREDGFVRRLNVTYDAMDDGRDIKTRYTFTYTDVGTATVTPPEWADEARAEFDGD